MFEDTCDVISTSNNRMALGEILEFKENDRLVVSINRAIKLTLRWNGKIYVGESAGLEFTSLGPRQIM